MTKPTIGDCFIGNFPQTQGFGENPQAYTQFGLKGHDGIDFSCATNTQIIASTDGQVIKVSNDPNGYGNFVEIWDEKQLCATLYAHLDHSVVAVGDRVVRGQLIGLSDNTGNSTGPHLHFGFCLTDQNGVRLNQNNGYFGWLDPDTNVNWQLTNPSSPITSEQTVSVPSDKFTELVTKSTLYDAIKAVGYNSIDDILKKVGDLNNNNTQLQQDIQTCKSQLDASVALTKKLNDEDLQAVNDSITAQHERDTVQGKLNQVLMVLDLPFDATIQTVTQTINSLKAPNDKTVSEYQKLVKAMEDLQAKQNKVWTVGESFRLFTDTLWNYLCSFKKKS